MWRAWVGFNASHSMQCCSAWSLAFSRWLTANSYFSYCSCSLSGWNALVALSQGWNQRAFHISISLVCLSWTLCYRGPSRRSSRRARSQACC